jgi:hypothetical protein
MSGLLELDARWPSMMCLDSLTSWLDGSLSLQGCLDAYWMLNQLGGRGMAAPCCLASVIIPLDLPKRVFIWSGHSVPSHHTCRRRRSSIWWFRHPFSGPNCLIHFALVAGCTDRNRLPVRLLWWWWLDPSSADLQSQNPMEEGVFQWHPEGP